MEKTLKQTPNGRCQDIRSANYISEEYVDRCAAEGYSNQELRRACGECFRSMFGRPDRLDDLLPDALQVDASEMMGIVSKSLVARPPEY